MGLGRHQGFQSSPGKSSVQARQEATYKRYQPRIQNIRITQGVGKGRRCWAALLPGDSDFLVWDGAGALALKQKPAGDSPSNWGTDLLAKGIGTWEG